MVHDYAEDLLQSIKIVAEYCYKDQKFDETLICTIINDNDCKNGHYIVSDGNIKFDAYSDSADYRVDDVVRVTIIKGDYSQKKYIAGKCVSEESNQPLTYVSPSASVLDMTNNLIKDVAEGGLIANSGRTYNDAVAYEAICIWSTNLQDNEFKDIQNNSIYDSIILKADFKTMLSEYNITSGSYGLYMDLYVTTAGNGENYSRKRFYLDSSDMFGDPYNFLIYSNQEAKFNIAQTDTIHTISLYFYQENNFTYRDNNGLYLELQKNPLNIADLLVSNIYIGMGTDLANAEDNKLVIYTHDDLKYNIDDTETSNQKEIGLLWYNKDEDNKYIGFSDGVIQYNDNNEIIVYDEKEYLDKSAVITRLVAQQGKEGVPDDKTALELSADLDELKVVLPKIKKAVAKSLYAELKNFNSRLDAIQSGVAQHFNPWLEKDSETNINKRSENLEASINNLIEYYINGLAYASAIQAGEKAEFEDIESLQDYEKNIINSLNNNDDENNPLGIIPDIKNFLNELKITIKTSYSSFMGAYDAYEIRIQKILQDIQKYLDEFKTISEQNYEKFTTQELTIDGTVIKGILLRTTEEFEPYIPEDLSIYDNQYCIYWYQYQNGYEGDAFGASDWKLLDVNNVGLPDPTDEGKYPPKATTADSNAILHLSLHTENREEKFKAVLFYNHVQYNSNEIIFINERPVLDEVIKNNIIIEHGNDSYDSYAKYGIDNILIDATDYNRPRTLRLRYTDEQGNFDDNKLIGASVYWYIPNNATQLRYDLKDFSEDFTNDINSEVKDDEFTREGFTCFYRKITGKEEEIDSASREFIYRIADYFAPTNTQNTIYCVVVKGQVKIEAFITFNFSTFGSNGTDYTLRIGPVSSQVATTDSVDENENQLLFNFEAVLYDYNNEKIDIIESNEVQVKVITPQGKETLTPQFQDGKIIGSIGAPVIDTSTNIRCYYQVLEVIIPVHWETTDKTVSLTAYYVVPYALTSVYYIEGPSTIVYDSQGGNPSYYKNPFKLFWNEEVNSAVMAQEDNEITWDMIYYHYDEKTKKIIQMSASELGDEYKIVKSYMPSLSNEYILTPSIMYLQEEQMTLYPVVLGTKNDIVYWAQPIYLMQNRYPSAMLNSWDGSLKIDEKNGTILSNLVGAGKKNSDNSFSGVLMGEVEANTGIQVEGTNSLERSLAQNQTGMGLYGFHEGAQSFGFNINGTAFLGKSGGGRISFDGNHGFIYSQNWLNSFKHYSDTKDENYNIEEVVEIDGISVIKYWDGISYENPFEKKETGMLGIRQGKAGMAIDLQHGHIDAFNFKLTSNGIQLNSNPNSGEYYIQIGDPQQIGKKGITYSADGELKIRADNFYIGTDPLLGDSLTMINGKLYVKANEIIASVIYSYNWEGTLVDENNQTLIDENGKPIGIAYYNMMPPEEQDKITINATNGMYINLNDGTMWSKKFAFKGTVDGSYLEISSTPSIVMYYQPNDVNLLNISPDNFILQSKDWENKSADYKEMTLLVNSLRVRNGPGTNNTQILHEGLPKGHVVRYLGETITNNVVWYKIDAYLDDLTGDQWVCSTDNGTITGNKAWSDPVAPIIAQQGIQFDIGNGGKLTMYKNTSLAVLLDATQGTYPLQIGTKRNGGDRNFRIGWDGSLKGGSTWSWNINASGVATFNSLHANSGGSIGGWKISPSSLSAGNTTLSSTGKITATEVDLTGNIIATSGSFGRIMINNAGMIGNSYRKGNSNNGKVNNIGFCPGWEGAAQDYRNDNMYNKYDLDATSTSICLFVGVNSIVDPDEGNGSVDADFMVGQNGDTYIKNLAIGKNLTLTPDKNTSITTLSTTGWQYKWQENRAEKTWDLLKIDLESHQLIFCPEFGKDGITENVYARDPWNNMYKLEFINGILVSKTATTI